MLGGGGSTARRAARGSAGSPGNGPGRGKDAAAEPERSPCPEEPASLHPPRLEARLLEPGERGALCTCPGQVLFLFQPGQVKSLSAGNLHRLRHTCLPWSCSPVLWKHLQWSLDLLPACELRDDGTLRGRERETARFHFFNLKKSKDNWLDKDKSSCRENMMKSRVLEQEDFGVPSFDTGSNRTQAESRLTQPHRTARHDAEDALRSAVSAATLQAGQAVKEARRRQQQQQHPLQAPLPLDDATASRFPSPPLWDNEQKPLSSAASQARTSLRSQMRSRAGQGKERFRVSFSEGPSLDFSGGDRDTGRTLDVLDLGRDASPARSVAALSDSRKSSQAELPSRDLRLDSCAEHLHVPYSAHYRELMKKLHQERKAADDTSRFTNELLAATPSSGRPFLGPHSERELSPASPLKLSSEAKPKSPFLPLAHSASASFGDFLSVHGPLPSEAPLENLPPDSSLTSVPRKGQQEPPACRSLSPSRVEFRHAPSQRTPGTPKPCFHERGLKYRYSEQQSSLLRGPAEEPPSPEKSSPVVVVTVLRQLLELVDRYWAGSGSLLLNKEFLAPARDLLARLVTLAPSSSQEGPSAGLSYRIQAKPAQHWGSGSGRPEPKQAENQVASSKERDLDAAAAFRLGPHRASSLSYDELLTSNEVLSAQVDVLSLELKQLKKQQETLSLLRESQRSLVSTNNFLLQQLTREQSPSAGRAADLLLSGKGAPPGSSPSFCEKLGPPAAPPALSSAFGSTLLLRGSMEQL